MRGAALMLVLALLPAVAQAQETPASGSRMEVQTERAATVPDIEVAWRAFAAGDLDAAERMLTDLVERQPSPAAFLLRGCTRYTRAMLSRDPGTLPEGARADVRRAFSLNPSLRLDPRRFSPRLIAFLEEVRQQQ